MAALELKKISKHFGAIRALTEIDLTLEPGEVLGLMGDNGAGKSTLVKIIAGNFPPSSGDIVLGGTPVHFHKPVEARQKGIEVVYQDLALCNNLTAAANVFLGREITKSAGPFRILSYAAMYERAGELFKELKSETRPGDLVRRMSGGQRQAVAIARTRLSDARIVLMDEPTAAISVRQVVEVLDLIRRLRDHGIAIVLISHRMPDVFAVADRIFVLRRGRKVAEKAIAESSPEEVTGLITGAIHAAEAVRDSATTGVAISDVVGIRESNALQKLIGTQAFWVTVALAVLVAVMSWRYPNAFGTSENFYNVTRNFSFIGIMALGMTAVIITGGIDLSVGSVVGVVGIVFGLIMQAGYHWALAVAAGLLTGFLFGLFNGILISAVGLPPFVVTLGTLSIARSVATVLSQNKIIYQFGPYADFFFGLFGGSTLGIDNSMWLLVIMTVAFGLVLYFTQWGRHLFAIGGNEQAARLTGVPVDRVKVQAYVFCSVAAAIGSIMILGWIGSANNALGTGYELRVIASTVIGGANLMGGEGGAYGAFIGAALIEVIRNSLLMAGVDSNYQGMFVGAFIILAVLLERVRGRKRE